MRYIEVIEAIDTQPQWVYGFLLDWYEDHRIVPHQDILQMSRLFPYSGKGFRIDANIPKPYSSWAKDKNDLELHYNVPGTRYQAEIYIGVDMELAVNSVLHLDPQNSDLHDILEIKEIIALEFTIASG